MERPRQGAPEYHGFGPIRHKREKMHQHGHKKWPSSKLINKMPMIQAKRPTRMTSIQASRAIHQEAAKRHQNDQQNEYTPTGANKYPMYCSRGALAGARPPAALPEGPPRGRRLPRAAGAGPRAPVWGRRPVPRGNVKRQY